mmetsp:Transcript_15274/g.34137  ORF Transcript_15274/g.34137 Transcript_15274/m.34137 type:complete len:228 (+) Transcript_15274:232-915(+)
MQCKINARHICLPSIEYSIPLYPGRREVTHLVSPRCLPVSNEPCSGRAQLWSTVKRRTQTRLHESVGLSSPLCVGLSSVCIERLHGRLVCSGRWYCPSLSCGQCKPLGRPRASPLRQPHPNQACVQASGQTEPAIYSRDKCMSPPTHPHVRPTCAASSSGLPRPLATRDLPADAPGGSRCSALLTRSLHQLVLCRRASIGEADKLPAAGHDQPTVRSPHAPFAARAA